MVRYHPYQNVYFNFLAGSKMSIIKGRYAVDGWGLAVKQGLEYIAQSNPDQKVRVRVDGLSSNILILLKADREWLLITKT